MSDKWMIHNFITGEEVESKKLVEEGPTEAWVNGWNDGMDYGGSAINPYTEATTEWHDWDDGCEAAKKD